MTAPRRPPSTPPAAPAPPELDLFDDLIDALAADLAALPPDAWTREPPSAGVASLAERLAALRAIRHARNEEEVEHP